MATAATLTGGAAAAGPVPLTYNATDAALAQSRLLAASTGNGVSAASYYKSIGTSDTVSVGGAQPYDLASSPDTIKLAAGDETIKVIGTDYSPVHSAASVAGGSGQFSMSFVGAASASTVLSGIGGASQTATVTIFGGGSGDTLHGGSGSTSIVAGAGNETLVAGSGQTTMTGAGVTGQDVFKFTPDGHVGGVTDVVTNFTHAFDFLDVSAFGPNAEAYVLGNFKVADGKGSFTLQDGTKVVLDGVTKLAKDDFHKS